MMKSTGINGENADEMKELWSIVAGSNDSEIVEEAKKTEKNPKISAKRKRELKNEKSEEEIAKMVEGLMAIFDIAWEDDVALNLQSKPCLNKLRKLPLLIESLSKKHLQKAFIDRGVFTLLKNWLEPLPDESIPNMTIRHAILSLLTDQFRFDVNDYFVKEQLKKSCLGKAIMFLSLFDEETKSNQKLAKELIYRWSRGLYNISTRFEDARPINDDMIYKRPCIRKPIKNVPVAQVENDPLEVEIYEFSSGIKKMVKSYATSRAQVPKATCMSFVISPQSKFVKKNCNDNERHNKIAKKIKELGMRTRRTLQQVRLSRKN